MEMNTSFAFSATFPIFRNRIISIVEVSAGYNNDGKALKCRCLWDTGASLSLITSSAADALGLKIAEGQTRIRSGLGAETSVAYRTAFLHVVLGAIPVKLKVGVIDKPSSDDDIDMVLGLDFITKGSFAISYDAGLLMFSFCYPPTPFPVDFTDMLPRIGLHPITATCEGPDNMEPVDSDNLRESYNLYIAERMLQNRKKENS